MDDRVGDAGGRQEGEVAAVAEQVDLRSGPRAIRDLEVQPVEIVDVDTGRGAQVDPDESHGLGGGPRGALEAAEEEGKRECEEDHGNAGEEERRREHEPDTLILADPRRFRRAPPPAIHSTR